MAKKSNQIENKVVDNISVLDFKQLKVEKYKTFGNIVVYNINHKDNADRKQKLLDFLKEHGDFGELIFSGKEVVTKLFPILTNYNVSNCTDEEIEDVLSSPSQDLVNAKDEIQYIVLKNIINDIKNNARMNNLIDDFNDFVSKSEELKKLVSTNK